MGAFSRFLAEVEEQPVATETLGVLEELAGWQDLDVDNLIALDVVEVLDPELLNRLRSRWGPSMTRVFADSERRWMEAELDLDHDLD
jgi:hypothetical protein